LQVHQALAKPSPTLRLQALLPLAERWPEQASLWVHAARLCLELGQVEDAWRLLGISLQRHPHDTAAQAELGRTLFITQQVEAQQLLIDAVTRGPWQVRGWQYLLRLLELTRAVDGEHWAQRAVAAHPHNYALGLMAVRLCSPGAAIALLAQVLDGVEALLEGEELTTVVPAFS
jgi:predicted Zn-dependent protease